MELSDFDYKLPKELIAQKPASPRDHSRLMILGKDSSIEHKHFYDIIDYLEKDDVLVINEAKVDPARLVGRKDTGARVEILITETDGKRCKCHIKATKPRIGNKLIFGNHKAEIIGNEDDVFIVEFDSDVGSIMDKIGEMPTPPYITRKIESESEYQTVYSKKKGSVAAPTAGLHFTGPLLDRIEKKGIKIAKITLHVGLGTFLPVKDLKTHKMHKEHFEIDKENADIINKRKGKLIVVGTTSLRALESAADKDGIIVPQKTETEIFIKPGYMFKTKIDALITNFHLPKSTLLMLVSALAGKEKIMNSYHAAIKENYRFFSFGDAMLILV